MDRRAPMGDRRRFLHSQPREGVRVQARRPRRHGAPDQRKPSKQQASGHRHLPSVHLAIGSMPHVTGCTRTPIQTRSPIRTRSVTRACSAEVRTGTCADPRLRARSTGRGRLARWGRRDQDGALYTTKFASDTPNEDMVSNYGFVEGDPEPEFVRFEACPTPTEEDRVNMEIILSLQRDAAQQPADRCPESPSVGEEARPTFMERITELANVFEAPRSGSPDYFRQ